MQNPPDHVETFDELLDVVLPLAERLLDEEGEFLPFAAATSVGGGVVSFNAEPDVERPSSRQVLEVLLGGLRAAALRGEHLASGLCANVRVSEMAQNTAFDAVRIHFEARSGETIDYFRPYEIIDDGVTFGEPFIRPSVPYIFFLPGTWSPP